MGNGKTRKLINGIDNQTKPLRSEENNDLVGRFCPSTNILVKGEHGDYEIDCNHRLGAGGEGVVYYGHSINDGCEVAIKVLDNFVATNGPIRDKVISFLRKNSSNTDLHLMPLIDEGIVEVEGYRQSRISYPFDVLPYIEGGPVTSLSYSELKEKMIPQILEAINAFHSSNLVHRDIKPDNIYYLNGSYLLSDFSTVSEVTKGGNFHGTSSRRGTKGYSAPEIWQGYVAYPADYYSLGCTIATLYNGKHVYSELLDDSRDEGALNKAINDKGMPLNCPEDESDIQLLVDSLINMKEECRPDYDGVKLWLSNFKDFELKFKIKTNESKSLFEYHFEGKVYSTIAELADGFAHNWEKAKKHLYSGGAKGSPLIRTLSTCNQDMAVELANIVESRRTATNYDLGLAMALHIMNPESPIYWQGHIYSKLSDIAQNDVKDEESISSLLSSGFLSYKLRNKIDPGDINRIEEMEGLSKTLPNIAVKSFQKTVGSGDSCLYKGYRTLDEVVTFIFDYAKNDNINNYLNDEELFGFLVSHGFRKEVQDFYANNNSKEVQLIKFYVLFESITKDPLIVRNYFRKYGPYADLNWVYENIGLYKFVGPNAKVLSDIFKTYDLNNELTISKMREIFVGLNSCVQDLQELFTVDFGELILFGRSDSLNTSEIISVYSDAFFIKEWNGHKVANGFLRFINDAKGLDQK